MDAKPPGHPMIRTLQTGDSPSYKSFSLSFFLVGSSFLILATPLISLRTTHSSSAFRLAVGLAFCSWRYSSICLIFFVSLFFL